jgi:hypothetical protein
LGIDCLLFRYAEYQFQVFNGCVRILISHGNILKAANIPQHSRQVVAQKMVALFVIQA